MIDDEVLAGRVLGRSPKMDASMMEISCQLEQSNGRLEQPIAEVAKPRIARERAGIALKGKPND
ncbi:hypothetical protein [Rhizobium sp. RAF56]|uniref:hypothetical protein n=1 Tax=Rhizobium sp. RAF56 TaxID=3233062 RepID=UPI003F9BF792